MDIPLSPTLILKGNRIGVDGETEKNGDGGNCGQDVMNERRIKINLEEKL